MNALIFYNNDYTTKAELINFQIRSWNYVYMPPQEYTKEEIYLFFKRIEDKVTEHTAAYEKYNLAFIKILDNLEQIDSDLYKSNEKKIDMINLVLTKLDLLSNDIRHQNEQSKLWRDNIIEKIDSYAQKDIAYTTYNMDKITQIIKNNDEVLSKNSQNLQVLFEILDKIKINLENSDKATSTYISGMKDVPYQITNLFSNKNFFQKHFEKFIYFIGALGAVLSVVIILIELHILDLYWK